MVCDAFVTCMREEKKEIGSDGWIDEQTFEQTYTDRDKEGIMLHIICTAKHVKKGHPILTLSGLCT